jgi:hypothetical protein
LANRNFKVDILDASPFFLQKEKHKLFYIIDFCIFFRLFLFTLKCFSSILLISSVGDSLTKYLLSHYHYSRHDSFHSFFCSTL